MKPALIKKPYNLLSFKNSTRYRPSRQATTYQDYKLSPTFYGNKSNTSYACLASRFPYGEEITEFYTACIALASCGWAL